MWKQCDSQRGKHIKTGIQHETNENGSKEDNEIGGNHITIKMKQNDKNDLPKFVVDTFSNFSKQTNGCAG
jgi:hypothetical protein